MDLVVAEAAEEAAVAVARVEVAHLGPPAIHALDAAGGVEDEVAVGQVGALVVGEAEAEGETGGACHRGGWLVEMVVVLVE